MTKKTPNLTLSVPKCRFCNRYWYPAEGVIASTTYCSRCANARRTAATLRFDLKPVSELDTQGLYFLPRRFRSS